MEYQTSIGITMIPITRRSFLRFLLATPLAATVDVEKLLWVPSPIVTVPMMPYESMGQLVARTWEELIRANPVDNIFNNYWLLNNLKGELRYEINSIVQVEND